MPAKKQIFLSERLMDDITPSIQFLAHSDISYLTKLPTLPLISPGLKLLPFKYIWPVLLSSCVATRKDLADPPSFFFFISSSCFQELCSHEPSAPRSSTTWHTVMYSLFLEGGGAWPP